MIDKDWQGKKMIRLFGILLLALTAVFSAAPLQAQTAVGPADTAELEAFLDEVIVAQLAAHDVPGAAVAVVGGGELLLAKGYGVAEQEGNTAVDAERTLFRTGSVAKLVTWTAVMQQVEQGRLDLHADVNDYLDFTIPDTFPQPITLAHLMTHTAGFEDVGEALFVLSEAQTMPLAEYLQRLQPARVFPPGQVQGYSNYGTALAGYIVERVSGEPFADYVENHIFAPLGMARSTLRQPVPADRAADLAVGYGAGEHRHLAGGFVYAVPYPAGAMSAPAAELAPFMIAHLNNGRYQNHALLQPETVRLMHSRHFAADPRLDGIGYGFMEQRVNGRNILFHRGSMFQFNASLYLLPEENVGLYVAYNGAGAIDAPADLWLAFMEQFYPASPPDGLTPPPDAAQQIRPYAGEYHMSHADFSGSGKVIRLLEAAQVSATRDGELQLMVEGRAERYVPVEPGLFRHREREEWLAFRTGDDGTLWLSLDGRPAFVNFTGTTAYRVPWYASLSFSVLLLAVTLLLFIGSGVGWLIAAIRARRQGRERVLPRQARWLAGGFGLTLVLFLGSFIAVVGDIDPAFGVPRIFFGAPPVVDVILLLPWLLAVLALALAAAVGLSWRSAGPTLAARLHVTLLAGIALAVIWWLWYWNLLA